MKLYLNRLTARGTYRWQPGRHNDPSKASGSGGNPKPGLCSPDGEAPLGALRAWILAYGAKLEEDSRRDDSSGVWTKVLPRTITQEELLRRGATREGKTN